MRAILAIGVFASLSGCGSDQTAYQSVNNECSVKLAKLAANQELIPIMSKIVKSTTRERGCLELDGLLKDSAALYHFKEFKPADCDWSLGDNGPYEQAYNIIKRNQKPLSKLCDWARKDNESRLHRQGQAILDTLSPDERKALEQSYNGF